MACYQENVLIGIESFDLVSFSSFVLFVLQFFLKRIYFFMVIKNVLWCGVQYSRLFRLIPKIPKQTIIIQNQILITTKINSVKMPKICSTVVIEIMKEQARMTFCCILIVDQKKSKKLRQILFFFNQWSKLPLTLSLIMAETYSWSIVLDI